MDKICEERFWNSVDKEGTEDFPSCWIWKGGVSDNGWGQKYGYMLHEGKRYYTHRISYQLTHVDEDISNLCICHTCDNPKCVNPSHLWKGTDLDNARDKVQKGRQQDMSNEANPKSKLNKAIVQNIRFKYSSGNYTQKELAEEYGVVSANISLIVRNKIWRI